MRDYITANFAVWIIQQMEDELGREMLRNGDKYKIELMCKRYMKRIYNQLFPLMNIDDVRWVENKMDYSIGLFRMYASGCKVYDTI